MKPALVFYSDAIFIDDCMRGFTKNANSEFLSSLLQSVKEYTENYMKEHEGEDKFAMATDILVPGIFFVLGHPILAMLVKLLESYLHFSPGTVLENAWKSIQPAAKSGTLTQQGVETAAEDAAEQATGTPSTDIQHIKDSEIRYFRLTANGIPIGITKYAAGSKVATSLLAKIIKWVLLAVLASLGILVLGDIVNRFTGHKDTPPSASGLPSLTTPQSKTVLPTSTQTTLKPSKGYTEEHYNVSGYWAEPTPPENIGDTIVRWATDIYPDLQGHEDLIRSSENFDNIVYLIQRYNASIVNANYTFIPPFIKSRKMVVDAFIDEVASKYANLPKPDTTKERQ